MGRRGGNQEEETGATWGAIERETGAIKRRRQGQSTEGEGEIDRKTGRASEDGNNREEERSAIAKRRGGQSQGAEGGNRKEERAAHKKL